MAMRRGLHWRDWKSICGDRGGAVGGATGMGVWSSAAAREHSGIRDQHRARRASPQGTDVKGRVWVSLVTALLLTAPN